MSVMGVVAIRSHAEGSKRSTCGVFVRGHGVADLPFFSIVHVLLKCSWTFWLILGDLIVSVCLLVSECVMTQTMCLV